MSIMLRLLSVRFGYKRGGSTGRWRFNRPESTTIVENDPGIRAAATSCSAIYAQSSRRASIFCSKVVNESVSHQ